MASKKKKVSRRGDNTKKKVLPRRSKPMSQDEYRKNVQLIVDVCFRNLMADIDEAQQILLAMELRDPKAKCPF